jgi:hypothetical protein
VQVNDLGGREVFSQEDAGPLIELPLPAGIYLVSAQAGKVKRSYTLVLEQGASFDLHLCLLTAQP